MTGRQGGRPAAGARRSGILAHAAAVIQRRRGRDRDQAYLEKGDHRIHRELLAHGFRAEDGSKPDDPAS